MKEYEHVALLVTVLAVFAISYVPRSCTVVHNHPKVIQEKPIVLEPLPSPTPNLLVKELQRAMQQLSEGPN